MMSPEPEPTELSDEEGFNLAVAMMELWGDWKPAIPVPWWRKSHWSGSNDNG